MVVTTEELLIEAERVRKEKERLRQEIERLRRERKEMEHARAREAAYGGDRVVSDEDLAAARREFVRKRTSAGTPMIMPVTSGPAAMDEAIRQRQAIEAENTLLREGYQKAKVEKPPVSPTGPLDDHVRRVMEARDKILRGEQVATLPSYRGYTPDEAKALREKYKAATATSRKAREDRLAERREAVRQRAMARSQGTSIAELQGREAMLAEQDVKQRAYNDALVKYQSGQPLSAIDYIILSGQAMAGGFAPESVRGDILKSIGVGLGENATPESIQSLIEAIPGSSPNPQLVTPHGGVMISDGKVSMSIPFSKQAKPVTRQVLAAVVQVANGNIGKAFDSLMAATGGDLASTVEALKAAYPAGQAEIYNLVRKRADAAARQRTSTSRWNQSPMPRDTFGPGAFIGY